MQMDDLTALCMGCRRTLGEHLIAKGGAAMCPPTYQYFKPCKHERRQGTGGISADPSQNWSDETCQDCFKRFVIGNPPGLQASGEVAP